jgi:hypothetical protein
MSSFTLELRRGLVWGFTEAILVVSAEPSRAEGRCEVVVVHASGERRDTGRSVAAGDLGAFAREALFLVADRLGVEPGAFIAATHLDLGETGSLGVEPRVHERSASLLEQALASLQAPSGPLPKAPAPLPRGVAAAPDPGPGETPVAAPAASGGEAPGPSPSPAPRTANAPVAGPAETPSPAPGAVGPVATGPVPGGAEPTAAPQLGLLGRLVGWLRRAARAALGR